MDGWMDGTDGRAGLGLFVVVVVVGIVGVVVVVVGPLSLSLSVCTVRRALLIPLLLACVFCFGVLFYLSIYFIPGTVGLGWVRFLLGCLGAGECE